MKKFLALLLALTMVLALVACGGDDGKKDDNKDQTPSTPTDTTPSDTTTPSEPSEPAGGETYKVAMVTDYGDITDQSFNQTTYEACKEYCDGAGLDFKYYKPQDVAGSHVQSDKLHVGVDAGGLDDSAAEGVAGHDDDVVAVGHGGVHHSHAAGGGVVVGLVVLVD